MAEKHIHSPRLDTVLMVEDFIRENSGEYGKTAIWRNLPKKMMYQTFMVVFDHLLENNKIAVDSVGNVGWIWNPELVRYYLSRPDLRAR